MQAILLRVCVAISRCLSPHARSSDPCTPDPFRPPLPQAPIIDPNWDLTTVNGRQSDAFNHVWRGQIGTHFSDAEWETWFASYSSMLLHYAKMAADNGVAIFEVASELDIAFEEQAPRWRTLVEQVRKASAAQTAPAPQRLSGHSLSLLAVVLTANPRSRFRSFLVT
jgi:hypothetical protein